MDDIRVVICERLCQLPRRDTLTTAPQAKHCGKHGAKGMFWVRSFLLIIAHPEAFTWLSFLCFSRFEGDNFFSLLIRKHRSEVTCQKNRWKSEHLTNMTRENLRLPVIVHRLALRSYHTLFFPHLFLVLPSPSIFFVSIINIGASLSIMPTSPMSTMRPPLVLIVGPSQLLIVDPDYPTSPTMWPPQNISAMATNSMSTMRGPMVSMVGPGPIFRFSRLL